MKFILTIDCDNAAFDASPTREVRRILGEVGGMLRKMDTLRAALAAPIPLRDVNGNTVGIAEFKE